MADKQSDERYIDGKDFVTGDEAVGAIFDIVIGLVTLLVILPIRLLYLFIVGVTRRGRHRG